MKKNYLYIRKYLNRFQWNKYFSDIANSTTGKNLRIHNSSRVANSVVKDNVVLKKNVVIDKCEIGNWCKILNNSYLHNTELSDYSYVNMNSCILRSSIGKYCSIASNVYIGPGSHPLNYISTHPFTFLKDYGNLIETDDNSVVEKRDSKSIDIGNDVWIGQGAVIMDNIKIGHGSIVGAHAVVTHDVEPYSIVVGVPAKLIKFRFQTDVIDALLKIQWWDWDRSKIKESVNEFKHIDNFVKKYTNS
jgi:phosphonate metabolism protein (transferase hexapeptide repeat family)